MNNWMLATTLSLCLVSHAAAQSEPSPGGEPELSVEDLVKLVGPSLATIRVDDRQGIQRGLGTGFAVSADGLLATNLHVIGEGRSFVVEMADGSKPKVIAVEASDHTLDLALIRVAVDPATPLRPLPLQLEKVQQGTSVIAMGNPWGLEKSVVSGVVSAFREIAGREMIQLAMPVEVGNSGGPVVDHLGRVVGVVSMKSANDLNIGFAVQSGSLQLLIDKPNPVPVSRWSTIGALDPRRWKTLFGSRWREHGGRISVSGSGRGFGGRSLCLSEAKVPGLPFELAVTVKLNDEASAAGLVFHSDGNQRHYGFYPSNGKLRLTSFEGPTVFSWRILADTPSEHYRRGDWNDLKVRIEKDRLLCFVNGKLVIESADDSLTAGQVGLAKFRNTNAAFKRFQMGAKLGPEQLSDEALEKATNVIDRLPPFRDVVDKHLAVLGRSPAATASVLLQRARKLEDEADRLQSRAADLAKLANDMNLRGVTTQLAEIAAADDIDLLRGTLTIAQLEEQELDVEAYVDRVVEMASQIRDKLPQDASERHRFEVLLEAVFSEWGYHGSRFQYYDRANSFMHRVIDDREGLPITLSVLYMELGKQLDLQLEGVGLPGHFVVRFVPTDGDPQLVDVFDSGKLITRDEADAIVPGLGADPVTDEHLTPASEKEILARVLRNVYIVVEAEGDKEGMLRVLDGLLVLEPESVQFRGLRAVVRRETGRLSAAIADLDRVLESDSPGLSPEDRQRIRRMREFFRR